MCGLGQSVMDWVVMDWVGDGLVCRDGLVRRDGLGLGQIRCMDWVRTGPLVLRSVVCS